MRRIVFPAAACLAAFAVACGGDSASPSVTASPPPAVSATAAPAETSTPSPAASPASPEPTAEATQAAPTQPPATQAPTLEPASPAAASPTSQPGPPVTLAVSAFNLSFDRETISVPANSRVTVNFSNNDTSVDHDFGVSIPFVPHTATCAGPCTASISFDSGPPGVYTFQCSIHAEMVGRFTVG